MRLLFGIFGMAMMCSPALAGEQWGGAPYFELRAGLGMMSYVDTDPINEPTVLGQLVGMGSFSFENNFDLGIEAGIANIGNSGFRIGASWQWIDLGVDEVSFNGTLDGVDVSGTVPASAVEEVTLLNLKFNTHLVMANLYYDFAMPGSMIQPYIGIGGGGVFIEELESDFAIAAIAGVRVPFGDNGYIGGQYRLNFIPSLSADAGSGLDSTSLHEFLIVVGLQH